MLFADADTGAAVGGSLCVLFVVMGVAAVVYGVWQMVLGATVVITSIGKVASDAVGDTLGLVDKGVEYAHKIGPTVVATGKEIVCEVLEENKDELLKAVGQEVIKRALGSGS